MLEVYYNRDLSWADEATSALDTESEQLVQDALDKLLFSHTITTIIIAHRLQTVRNADVIALIDKGKVIEMGSHDDLMNFSDGRYRKLIKRSDSSDNVTVLS